MELIKRPFCYGTPGFLLTIGGHSMRLLRADLRELARLVNAALDEEPPPSIVEKLMQADAPARPPHHFTYRLKAMAVGDTLVLRVRDVYQYKSIKSMCSQMKKKRGMVFRTRSDLKGGVMVIRRVE